jgi:hypothetical protein
MNGRAQTGDMLVAQARERGVHRADLKLETEPFQRQHLRVAKRLRKHWIPGVKIAETHRLRLPIADCRLRIGKGFHAAI